MKAALTSSLVLKIFDRDLETELHTDASKDEIGALLLQKQSTDCKLHPVHYMSRKKTPPERNHHSYKLEAKTVVRAVKKFRSNLLRKEFKVVTDCLVSNQTLKKKEGFLHPLYKLDDPLHTYHMNHLELTGVKMRCKEDDYFKDIIEQQLKKQFIEDREEQRVVAKEQILKTQQENQRTYNLRRLGGNQENADGTREKVKSKISWTLKNFQGQRK